METTIDTYNYMVAGYGVFALISVIYLVSLYVRWRTLEREMHVLDEIAKK